MTRPRPFDLAQDRLFHPSPALRWAGGLLTVGLWLLQPLTAGGADLPFFSPPAEGAAPEPVEIQAETLEFQGDHYQASGGVTVLQGERKLTAASMAFDRATGELSAEGDVRLEDGGDLLASPKILWNLRTQTAVLHDGSLHLRKDNFHIRGRLIRRESPELYTIDTAAFTTCDGSPPSWQFRGKDIQVRLNHFLTA
ncbi:MAG: LPS-assembly protein LptD, partial [Nitrospirae bacterium]|nr:LPS-assembly protein LptD [Nitrospirota bacterium]